MNFVLILLVLILQHYVFTRRLCVPLTGYQALFFGKDAVFARLHYILRIGLWLCVPLLLFAWLDWYLRYELNLFFSLGLHFAVVLVSCGYAEVRTRVMQAANKEPVTLSACLYTAETLQTPASQGDVFNLLAIFAIRCLFVTLFFSFLFGGYGALLVLLMYSFSVHEQNNISPIRHLVQLIEWLPVRLLYISLVLDNNTAVIGKAFSSFVHWKSTEVLLRESIVRDVFEHNSLSNTVKIQRLWFRQLVLWLVTMAIVYLVYLLLAR